MEEGIIKTNVKISQCNHRRLNMQYKIDLNHHKQNHISNLHSYERQEQLFNRKINHLKKSLAYTPFSIDEDTNEEKPLTTPNCLARIQNHYRLLKFSSETEKRLLYQTPLSQLQSTRNHLLTKADIFESKNVDEQQKQRKDFLFKEFDELKHTIDDPYAAISVLAALSRTFLILDSGTE
ncbi:unnamed protein product [Adineta steineri]|uniref:Uncharacterized protein n=1 Tax=Adineta steineri TaxID=433720 RepID=A0A818NGH4_9BILA|nr:unnamed protein product [Adineta steineri]CAF3604416.1 unnamed protein product [Adineta steineri]